ncbi:MAG: molybdopterin-dependent oxidoreductase [Xanthobacteraceae bacterium]|nr:molybdopterin-dependent oxidoreductase [Xanthobacteraceae bacterium]
MTRPPLNPTSLYRRIPLAPHQMRDRRTRTGDAIILAHLGVPQLNQDAWMLTVDGLVDRPLTLRFADLARYPKVLLPSVHQCAGNPLEPFAPSQRVCNVVWGGVRLVDILAACQPGPQARYLWSHGADYGTFDGVEIDAYVKDLPLERAPADVLIAYELNGAPLPPAHGFPVRLVVPGFYGTNSVKWLTRMSLADRRADGPFTTRWYNDPVLDAAGQPTAQTTPVWDIAPQSIIVSPAPDAVIGAARETEVWGWAWGDGGIASVEVSKDDGATWAAAALEPPRGREWQRFSLAWRPTASGQATLCARATSRSGVRQPLAGRRNAVHRVSVRIG